MKKNILNLLILLCVLVSVGVVFAGSVYDRTYVSSGTNCIAMWTNDWSASAVDLKRVRVEKSLTATNVVTFVRINGGTNNVYTNTIGAVTAASGAGVQATLTANGLKYGDIIKATGIDAGTGAASNTFTVGFEYEVQQH